MVKTGLEKRCIEAYTIKNDDGTRYLRNEYLYCWTDEVQYMYIETDKQNAEYDLKYCRKVLGEGKLIKIQIEEEEV